MNRKRRSTESLQALSMTDETQASTSAPVEAVQEEEEYEGLTGGGTRKKRPQKKKPTEEVPPPAEAPPAIGVTAAPPPEPEPPKDDDEPFEGLTGGASRKRKLRKKIGAEGEVPKPADAAAAPSTAPPAQTPVGVPIGSQQPMLPLGQAQAFPGQAPPGFQASYPTRSPPHGRGRAPVYSQQGPPAGYPQQMPPAGYPQQMPPAGYPQQGPLAGYPQQMPPAEYPQQMPPAGYPQQMPPAGYPQQMPLAGYPQQMPPAGYPQQMPPAGYPQQGAPAVYLQQGPPVGYPQQGPPAGYPQQMPPAGYPQQMPPAGYPQQMPPAGYPQQMPPAGYPQQMPPAGYPQQMPPAGYPQQMPPAAGQQRPPQQQTRPPQKQQSPQKQQVLPVQQMQSSQEREVAPPAEPRGPPVVTKCCYQIPAKIIGKTVKARPVTVLCNYLPMNIKPMIVYRFDVAVKPEKPKKMVPVAFYAFMAKHFPKYIIAYDQNKIFYSPKKIPKVTDTERMESKVDVKDPNGKGMSFEVSIKGTGSIDLNTLINYMKGGTSLSPPTEAIQCMDIVLRQGTLKAYVKAGRTFFRRPANPLRLGDGLELWTGLFQSAIFTSRSYINIDVAHKGFPINQPIASLIDEFRLSTREPLEKQNRFAVETLNNMLRGLKVMACIGGDAKVKREYICNGIGKPANQQLFSLTDPSGREIQMTVADYFEKVKNIRLRMPYMNCLWVGPREKNIFYPLELLEVAPNQVLNKQLNDRQLAAIVKEAATPPDVRKRKIEDIIKSMDYRSNVHFKEFGLEINESFVQVQARVLNAPVIKYADKTVVPREGVWRSSKMLNAASLTSWGFMAVDRDVLASNSKNFIKMIRDQGQQMGMNISEPAVTLFNVPVSELRNNLEQAKKRRMQLMVVVVPNLRRPGNVYADIKKAAELSVGVLTQCVKEQTLMRLNPQTAKNILLKVNAKLTGVNHSLDASSLPACLRGGGVMVVGADVTHPSPDQQNIPSIAAVTASIDTNCFCYNIGLSIQAPKKEMIVEFEDIMVEHLRMYQSRQKALPKKIYVFRDGVSEGQFAEVLNSELVAVYRAYQRLSGSPKEPEVLFLLVQKRHHTRLFVPNSSSNVSAGTVVDTDIVHARELDFYLVSHAAIKGTARPTRYYAIRNDGCLPHDEVEQLVYYLCHLYSRCSRSVSYPTPTYYAHLACLRARVLTLGDRHDSAKLEKQPQRLKVLDVMQSVNPMFFV